MHLKGHAVDLRKKEGVLSLFTAQADKIITQRIKHTKFAQSLECACRTELIHKCWFASFQWY